jgi:hypothetical protein
MDEVGKLKDSIRHHNHEARFANETRRNFETGNYAVGGYATDHEQRVPFCKRPLSSLATII